MGKLLTDETGKLIVNAINNTETTKQRIAEINASAENAKQSALNEIQAVKDTIPADYSTLDFNMSMLMSSLKKTATGNGVVNLTNTAENGILKVTSNGNVTVKNQNMFEDILTDNIKKTNCNVSYDDSTGAYTVEYTGDGTNTFGFGNFRVNGSIYDVGCGKKLKYHKNSSVRINCEKTVNSGCYITFYDSNGIALDTINKGTNTTFKIKDVAGADFFTMKIGFDDNNGTFATGDIFHFSVQIEYGDTVSDFVVPQSNTENLSYGGITNVVGEGEITVEYVESMQKLYDNLATAIVALGGSL